MMPVKIIAVVTGRFTESLEIFIAQIKKGPCLSITERHTPYLKCQSLS
jgi:hypothetical protein